MTTGNLDVLGSIFTGLNYLNDASVTVDNKGRLRIEESRTTKHPISKEKDDRDLKIQTSDSSPGTGMGIGKKLSLIFQFLFILSFARAVTNGMDERYL